MLDPTYLRINELLELHEDIIEELNDRDVLDETIDDLLDHIHFHDDDEDDEDIDEEANDFSDITPEQVGKILEEALLPQQRDALKSTPFMKEALKNKSPIEGNKEDRRKKRIANSEEKKTQKKIENIWEEYNTPENDLNSYENQLEENTSTDFEKEQIVLKQIKGVDEALPYIEENGRFYTKRMRLLDILQANGNPYFEQIVTAVAKHLNNNTASARYLVDKIINERRRTVQQMFEDSVYDAMLNNLLVIR